MSMRTQVMGAGCLALSILAAIPAAADTLTTCLSGRDMKTRAQACESAARDGRRPAVERARAFRESGRLRARAGAHEDAIGDFDAAIALDASDTRTFEQRALSRLALGRLQGALTDLSLAITRQPDAAQLRIERGYAYLVMGQADQAIIDFSAALAIEPRNAVALNNRGLAWRKKNNAVRARADYTAAIAVSPTYAQAYVNRAYLAEAEGNKKAAIADFEQALLFDPKHRGALAGLGRLGVAAAGAISARHAGEGKQLVETLCSRCHAVSEKGESPNPAAPAFRDLKRRYPLLALREPITRGIVAPHAEMPSFALNPGDVDRIVAYVNTLAR